MGNAQLQTTTVWSFPQRGSWATHNPKFRGNFAPQIPQNIILKYSKTGDTILDPMMGGGTTLIEAKCLGRNAIGIDINPGFVELTDRSLKFEWKVDPKIRTRVGDVRDLSSVGDESIDLVVTHPPYLNIIKYSDGTIPGDLSMITSPFKFSREFRKGVSEMYRVLKPGKYCAILIGDTRRARHYVPLAFLVMQGFLKCGFLLKEDIIKLQHNCESTHYWQSHAGRYGIYLIMHEHLFVFRKPKDEVDYLNYPYSRYRNE